MRSGLGVPCWDTPDAIAPKSGTQEPQLEWQVPVAAAATGATLHTAAMGQGGPVADNFGQPVDRFTVFRVDGQPEDSMDQRHKKYLGVDGVHGDAVRQRFHGQHVLTLSQSKGVGLGGRFDLHR